MPEHCQQKVHLIGFSGQGLDVGKPSFGKAAHHIYSPLLGRGVREDAPLDGL
jgi:hypothetical protein